MATAYKFDMAEPIDYYFCCIGVHRTTKPTLASNRDRVVCFQKCKNHNISKRYDTFWRLIINLIIHLDDIMVPGF